tara:strand:- start:497771 stop:498106 length:336 start_codon:yes stop_codon:yes gene_type:complete
MSESPIEVDVTTVNMMLQQNDEFLLLDVRETVEHATAKIDGSTLIPMSELRDRFEELDAHREKRIVVHCHHGGRSMQVVQVLRAQGFEKAQNMAGGIDQWSQQIDPEVPRY